MTNNTTQNYSFAVGKRIKRILTESLLYLDGTYNEYTPCQNLSVRRLDKPLFILLENNDLLRLYGTSLSITDNYEKEYVISKNFPGNSQCQNEFKALYDRTIVNVQEIYVNNYDLLDDSRKKTYDIGGFCNCNSLTDLALELDNGLRLVCYMFLDYFDIEIVDKGRHEAIIFSTTN